jgi:hypothetical protein
MYDSAVSPAIWYVWKLSAMYVQMLMCLKSGYANAQRPNAMLMLIEYEKRNKTVKELCNRNFLQSVT